MAKKQAYYGDAEKMFVENGATLAGISKKLEVTEKTLREWKKEGEWDRKRSQFLKIKNSCNVELHKMIGNLAQQVNDQIQGGEKPDPQMLYGINQLAATMLKLKTYEDSMIQEETSKEEKTVSSEEILGKVHDILGIR